MKTNWKERKNEIEQEFVMATLLFPVLLVVSTIIGCGLETIVTISYGVYFVIYAAAIWAYNVMTKIEEEESEL